MSAQGFEDAGESSAEYGPSAVRASVWLVLGVAALTWGAIGLVFGLIYAAIAAAGGIGSGAAGLLVWALVWIVMWAAITIAVGCSLFAGLYAWTGVYPRLRPPPSPGRSLAEIAGLPDPVNEARRAVRAAEDLLRRSRG